MAAKGGWKDEYLVPGYEDAEQNHLKAGTFVYSLASALRPLNESQQTIIMQALGPLFEMIDVTAVPKSFTAMARRLGLQEELSRKLCRIDYCTEHQSCGFMQRIPLAKRTLQAMHLCEVCNKQIYNITESYNITGGPDFKYHPRQCDYVIDPYETMRDFLNRPGFFELFEEQWEAIEASIKFPDSAPLDDLGKEVYNDWLNGQARRFFRYVRDNVGGDFLKYERPTATTAGTAFIFVMDIADYMSSATNIASTKGAQTFGGFVSKLLSLPAACRNLSDWTYSDQVYNDGKKVKNPLQRQEWRLTSANEWKKGRLLRLDNGMLIRVHIVHMWWQGDGPMLEEIAGRTNFKNRAWWWQHPLVGIDVRLLGLANFHTVYPYSLNEKGMSTRNTPDMIDKQAQNVADAFAVSEKAGKAAVVANGCHWLCGFAGGLLNSRNVPGLAYFQFDYYNCQGWDHIHARIIADAIALATRGLCPSAREAITETIRLTQTARGEPRLCNWLANGHSKIHSIINWFLHDALYHLWRVLPEEELTMITMLWIHMVHIRGASPNEDDLVISELARDNYELAKEVKYGMHTAKPNDVKLLRAEFSVKEFMTLPTSSELVVDCGMKVIMLSLRKLMSNGSAMKGAMKR
jgi:hypothetical protein